MNHQLLRVEEPPLFPQDRSHTTHDMQPTLNPCHISKVCFQKTFEIHTNRSSSILFLCPGEPSFIPPGVLVPQFGDHCPRESLAK